MGIARSDERQEYKQRIGSPILLSNELFGEFPQQSSKISFTKLEGIFKNSS